MGRLHEYSADDDSKNCRAQFYDLWETCDRDGWILSTKGQDGDRTGVFDMRAECVRLATEAVSRAIDRCLDGPMEEFVRDLGNTNLPKGDTRDSFVGGTWAHPELSFVLWLNDWIKVSIQTCIMRARSKNVDFGFQVIDELTLRLYTAIREWFQTFAGGGGDRHPELHKIYGPRRDPLRKFHQL